MTARARVMAMVIAMVAVGGVALACTACASSGTVGQTGTAGPTGTAEVAGSRAELYLSLDELADASDEIVVVSVEAQQPSEALGVSESIAVSTVVAALGEAGSLRAGDPVEVRQLDGGGTTSSVEQPLLELGSQYLLFLTPTGLPGDEADQYFIVGVSAGIYAPVAPIDGPVADDAEFAHVGPIDADRIPERFRAGDLP